MLNRVAKGALLVAGTSIGAAALPLPLSVMPYGLGMAWLLMTGMWLLMMYAGLLVVEVQSSLPNCHSYVSMAKETLGRWGQGVTWVCYMLLLYSLLAAYLTGLSSVFSAVYHAWFVVGLGSIACVALFWGTSLIERCNRWVSYSLALIFFGLSILLICQTHAWSSGVLPWSGSWQLAPLILLAFGFHVVIPSVVYFLKGEVLLAAKSVQWGSFVPWVLYIIWTGLVCSVLPQASGSIDGSAQVSQSLVSALSHTMSWRGLPWMIEWFVMGAILTSLCGIGLSLRDVWFDVLPMVRSIQLRLCVPILVVLPAIFYALWWPHGFMAALRYAAIFVVLFNGLFPCVMVAILRTKGVNSLYRAPLGGYGLVGAGCLFMVLLVISVYQVSVT